MKISVLAFPLLAATAARAAPLPAPTFGGADMWDPTFWMNKWGHMLGGGAGLYVVADWFIGLVELVGLVDIVGGILKWIKYAHNTLRSESLRLSLLKKFRSAFTPTGSTSTSTDDSTSSSGSIPSSTSESSSSNTDGSTGTSTSTGSGGGSGLAALEKMASQVIVLVALNLHTRLTRAVPHPSAYMAGSKGSGVDSTANTAGESTGTTSGASNSARSITALDTTPPTGGSSVTTDSKAVVSGSTPATEAQLASKANTLAKDRVSSQAKAQKAALNQTTTPTVVTKGTTA
ncbi:BZ3500_MvSof-1268-A1-R1_Chr11-2g03399 [Microbotryum saponariae]|uniref:BZ3500_MvSof-1268-A1-R1_Chr11-2g03399 protein n=1 Tax=Microbotryum saponariae TaxID=289078 RepID=A0A2X0N7P7_9BASI|nr:BZ3500_MvSof-1268-A1-R1_Chr11-2g03399 [Microbotryum saponariae]SDA03292.1 BZ3501_MvSof-1269-A2-R1_Chr11g02970 [Microbotryum saponariae]